MTSDESTEQAIIATKTSTTPRVTPDDIEASIAKELFFTAGQAARGLNLPASPSDDLLTFCVLTLRNGFTVTGESACVSAENFSAQIGRDIARQDAVAKVRPLIERAAVQVGQGESAIGMSRAGAGIQINVFMPPAGGASLFAVFPDTFAYEQAKEAVTKLLEQGPLEPGIWPPAATAICGGTGNEQEHN